MNDDRVRLSKELMREQAMKNKAPSWLLIELAVSKGKELSMKYNVDESLVLSSLYLAHTVFDPGWKGEIQHNHTTLSSTFAKKYLDERSVDHERQDIILNAIQAHHNAIPCQTKVAEVMKNAECFKFVSVEGSLIWLHALGLR